MITDRPRRIAEAFDDAVFFQNVGEKVAFHMELFGVLLFEEEWAQS